MEQTRWQVEQDECNIIVNIPCLNKSTNQSKIFEITKKSQHHHLLTSNLFFSLKLTTSRDQWWFKKHKFPRLYLGRWWQRAFDLSDVIRCQLLSWKVKRGSPWRPLLCLRPPSYRSHVTQVAWVELLPQLLVSFPISYFTWNTKHYALCYPIRPTNLYEI